MARLARLYAPGCAHHVIQRGNNRQACFHNSKDKHVYLKYLQEASVAHGVAVHAYVLMTNHVHLLVTPESEKSCGKTMQSLGRRYVRYFNNQNNRTGTLWEGRYRSTLIDSDNYFIAVSRYIELNPVRADMVSSPSEYRWSSFGFNGLGRSDPLITPHPLYLSLSSDRVKRTQKYLAMFEAPISQELVADLREATNKGWAFGGKHFRKQIATRANRQVASSGWGGYRRSANDQGL